MGVDNTIAKLKEYFDIWHKKTTHLDNVYPIGAIYMSVNDTDPHELFGGTWVQIQGRFLLGSGTVKDEDNTQRSYRKGSTHGYINNTLISHSHTQEPHNHEQYAHSHGAKTDSYGNIWKPLLSDGDIKVGKSGYSMSKLSGGTSHLVYSPGDDDLGSIGEGNVGSSLADIKNSQPSINSNGHDDGADRNMPPYLVVNIWTRTA